MAALSLSLGLPLFALLVPLLELPATQAAALVGLLLVGGPEILALLAAALLGKETFQYFIYRAKRAVRAAVLVKPVSKAQYYFGLTINLASWVPLYFYGYFPFLAPGEKTRIYILATADFCFVASMFIMGGEFWEKLRRIFIWEGKT